MEHHQVLLAGTIPLIQMNLIGEQIQVSPLHHQGDGTNKRSRSVAPSDQHLNLQHSISDGALSYLGSPSDSFRGTNWTPPVRRFDFGEFSTPIGGARLESSVFSHQNERPFQSWISSMPNSLGSVSSLSESRRWASTGKQPVSFPRNLPGRHPFMSKPVYPVVFHNPVSDGEISSRGAPGDSSRTSPLWPEGAFSPDLKFYNALVELEKLEGSPETGAVSRREGFRWSNASSYGFAFEGDAIDIPEHISPMSYKSPNNSSRYQKCGICQRLLRQKSPWSSCRIMKNGDMPIAGVLPCRHVFHGECLEEITSKNQAHDPPCPLCMKFVGMGGSISFSEPLHMILRSGHRTGGAASSSNIVGSSSGGARNVKQQPHVMAWLKGSSIKRSFRRRFSFKRKNKKDAKIFMSGEP